MKLAFTGEAKYADFNDGYQLYCKRTKSRELLSQKDYNRIVKSYCRWMAERLCEDGIVDIPGGIGSIVTAELKRRPQYRKDKFVGYGKRDWSKGGQYDGTRRAFGITFMPTRMKKYSNLRCYGFVANRRLFQKIKNIYESGDAMWKPIKFNDDMI